MAKLRVQGADAGVVLDWVSAGAVNDQAETITYTLASGRPDRGRPDRHQARRGRLLVVASDTGHTLAWLARHAATAPSPTSPPTTASSTSRGLVRARCSRLTDVDLSTEAFAASAPRAGSRWPSAEVLCVRITYLGELGYELYVPRRHPRCLRRVAGRRVGPRCRSGSRRCPRCGWRRATATSATTSTTPTARSRPGSCARPGQAGRFMGRDAVVTARRRTPQRAGWVSGTCRSWCSTPTRCSTMRRCCTATVRRSAMSGRRPTAGRSAGPSASAMVSRRRTRHPRVARGRHLGGRRRRCPAPGRGVPAPDARPDLGPDQGLTTRVPGDVAGGRT